MTDFFIANLPSLHPFDFVRNLFISLNMVMTIIHLLCSGLLESVSNLTAAFIDSSTILISWSPPFALEGVPILGYNVTITNTTSGENITISVDYYATMLYYSLAYTDSDNFAITVVPINELGTGESAIAPTVDFIGN